MSYLDSGPVTLAPGDVPKLLDETTPAGALVINSGSAGRVWIGTTSSVGPTNGTPVDPSTGVTVAAGPTWVVLDPGATAAVPVYLTTKATSWQASPAAIAAQTAASLLATGVPNVLTGQRAYSGNFAGAASVDVSAYASTVIAVNQSWLNSPGIITATWSDELGNTLGLKRVQVGVAGAFTGTALTITLNVYGPRLSVTYSGTLTAGSGTALTIYGTNRTAIDSVGPPQATRILSTGVVSITSGTPIPLLAVGGTPSVGSGTMVVDAGHYWCRLVVSSASVTGSLQYLGVDLNTPAAATAFTVQDTTGLTTTVLSKYWEQALPAGVVAFQFLPSVTGSARVGVELTPCAF